MQAKSEKGVGGISWQPTGGGQLRWVRPDRIKGGTVPNAERACVTPSTVLEERGYSQ